MRLATALLLVCTSGCGAMKAVFWGPTAPTTQVKHIQPVRVICPAEYSRTECTSVQVALVAAGHKVIVDGTPLARH